MTVDVNAISIKQCSRALLSRFPRDTLRHLAARTKSLCMAAETTSVGANAEN